MGITLITAPTIDPVTLSEARLWIRERSGITSEDALITSSITSATKRCEEYTRRKFINQTWELSLGKFPSETIELPFSPLSSVTSITYEDEDGTTQTWASSNYQVDAKSEPGRVWVEPDISYPTTEAGRLDAVQITFVTGYGATAADVPQELKDAIKILVAHWFDNREFVTVGIGFSGQIPMPDGVMNMLDDYSLRSYV